MLILAEIAINSCYKGLTRKLLKNAIIHTKLQWEIVLFVEFWDLENDFQIVDNLSH